MRLPFLSRAIYLLTFFALLYCDQCLIYYRFIVRQPLRVVLASRLIWQQLNLSQLYLDPDTFECDLVYFIDKFSVSP